MRERGLQRRARPTKIAIDGGLHVVVDPALAGAAPESERLVMGVKHHLLALAWIGPHTEHPATMLYGHRDWRARASARPPAYIGRGLNRWSNAHIDDAAELYCLALEKAEPGTFLYVESGEEELGLLARHAATLLGLPHAHALDPTYAVEMLGREVAVFALGSNSRVRGAIGRDLLGWRPRHHSIVKWLDTADDESRPYV